MTDEFPILRPRLYEDVAAILKARQTGPRRWQSPCHAHANGGQRLVIGADDERLLVGVANLTSDELRELSPPGLGNAI